MSISSPRDRLSWSRTGVCAALLSIGLASCTTTSQSTNGDGVVTAQWEIDSVGSKCVSSVVGGAVIGAVIGAIAGGGQRVAAGAIAGGAVGVGMCAVIMALDAQDRARIREAQLRAAQTNEPQVLSYQGNDGLHRDISVKPTKTVAATKTQPGTVTVVGDVSSAGDTDVTMQEGQMLCRELQTDAFVETKGSASVPAQLVCRQPDGSYAPERQVASASDART